MKFSLRDMLFKPKDICLCCGEEVADDYICEHCKSTLETIEDFKDIDESKCFSPYLYSGHIKRMLGDFKFREKRYYGKVFAKLLADFYNENELSYDILVPLPLSKQKYLKRGFNQCEILCDMLSKRIDVPVNKEILYKVKDTKDQHLLSSHMRKSNLNHAFKAKSYDDILNKRILLVDDLITFGYTLKEAVETLKSSGYTNVDCMVIGKARPESPLKRGR